MAKPYMRKWIVNVPIIISQELEITAPTERQAISEVVSGGGILLDQGDFSDRASSLTARCDGKRLNFRADARVDPEGEDDD